MVRYALGLKLLINNAVKSSVTQYNSLCDTLIKLYINITHSAPKRQSDKEIISNLVSIIQSVDVTEHTATITLNRDVLIKSDGSLITFLKGHKVDLAKTINLNPPMREPNNASVKYIDKTLKQIEIDEKEKLSKILNAHNHTECEQK